ncbi:MAG: hypothetical protein LUG96_12530, partial [Tannerellaceae bacterium]|nr:hypothetical protein [Tannerellaceae bacterium]
MKDQNVTIGFEGFEGCTVSADKTSLSTDLYVITDGHGKYLAMPIFQTLSNETTIRNAEWATIERNMDPWTMPAFQWVVEQTQTAAILKETSPIKITNREYGVTIVSGYQLYVDKEGTEIAGVKLMKENFEVDTKNVKKDPYVGYKTFNKDSLLIAGYTFRYLSEASSEDLFLTIGGLESDSVLYANTNKVVFALDTIPSEYLGYGNGEINRETFNYGYTPTTGSGDKEKPLTGWSELERRFYSLKVKGAKEDTYVVLDDEGRYATSNFTDWKRWAEPKTPVRFYLKTNNIKDGNLYYALVDYTTNYTDINTYSTPKGGIDDNSLMLNSNPL